MKYYISFDGGSPFENEVSHEELKFIIEEMKTNAIIFNSEWYVLDQSKSGWGYLDKTNEFAYRFIMKKKIDKEQEKINQQLQEGERILGNQNLRFSKSFGEPPLGGM